jgi:hypothetical protein
MLRYYELLMYNTLSGEQYEQVPAEKPESSRISK